MAESAMDFLERVKARAKELYAASNQGDWDAPPAWVQRQWINAAGEELRGKS